MLLRRQLRLLIGLTGSSVQSCTGKMFSESVGERRNFRIRSTPARHGRGEMLRVRHAICHTHRRHLDHFSICRANGVDLAGPREASDQHSPGCWDTGTPEYWNPPDPHIARACCSGKHMHISIVINEMAHSGQWFSPQRSQHKSRMINNIREGSCKRCSSPRASTCGEW